MQNDQTDFDTTIGQLDRVLSKLVLWSHYSDLDLPNKQTLKHHAEDMIAAADHILKLLKTVEGTPQPQLEEKPEVPCGIVVIAIETSMYLEFLKTLVFPHYEIYNFFKTEGFKTLEEVEAWWENK